MSDSDTAVDDGTSLRPDAWVGRFPMATHDTLHLTVGPMWLNVHRSPREWLVRRDSSSDLYADRVALERSTEERNEVDDAREQRFVVSDAHDTLEIAVRTPDRAVISRPATPLTVPCGEQVQLYLSFPLWVALQVGDSGLKLTEFPSVRLSDTWFGPNTREGSLCYATRSRCRLNLEDHPHLPYRAIAPLIISNRSSEPLLLERVRLPVTMLSLYRDGAGRFWSQPVTLVREESGDMAELRIGDNAPDEAAATERVAGPREVPQRNTLIRAFTALF